jgi:hypothetical protein
MQVEQRNPKAPLEWGQHLLQVGDSSLGYIRVRGIEDKLYGRRSVYPFGTLRYQVFVVLVKDNYGIGSSTAQQLVYIETAIVVNNRKIGVIGEPIDNLPYPLCAVGCHDGDIEVIDLGTDVSPEAFVNAAVENNCNIICCSALLTTTMDVMADVVKAAEEAGIRDKVKIMIGGAPVTEEFKEKIGADCYTSDAASAADAAVELCKA